MKRRIRGGLQRYLPTQYLFPIMLLLGSGFGCLAVLLLHTTSLQDRAERSREIEIVTQSLRESAAMVTHDLQDYARWNDAVRHVVLAFDPRWIDENVSSYLGMVQGYSHVLVVDEAGQGIYAFSGGKRGRDRFDPALLLGPAFASVMKNVRAIPTGGSPIVSGFTRMDDRVYVFAAAAVVPISDKLSLPPGAHRMLVLAQRVDQAYFDELAHGRHVPRLRLVLGKRDVDTLVPLRDVAGGPIGAVEWKVLAPGTALRRDVLPWLLLIGLVALTAAALILRHARMGMDALRHSKALALHQALHDPLTGLGNRRAVIERLESCRGAVTLLYMDLDGFKETNDVYGHAAGDALLVEAARRIAAAAGPDATLVARSGGDEFAIVLEAGADHATGRISGALLAGFQAPFAVGGYSVSAGISIGVVASPGGMATDELIRRADVAMYAAKANGKDCCCTYHPAMDEEHEERRQLEGDLRAAIARNGIGVMFQPIVDARSGAIVAAEALARWTHPVHGKITPDIFVRVAERSGLINELGRSVLLIACREALHWDLDLAVNLSPAQFWDRTLVQCVADVLRETGFPAHRLELEITESYLLRRPDAAEAIIGGLRALGIRIALDDFGTGFASIGYLRRLSFDRIKIDRSFVTDVGTCGRATDMARAIVALADALDLSVTAEGIETETQAAIMRAIGCARMQGWLFGRPARGSEIGHMLEGSGATVRA